MKIEVVVEPVGGNGYRASTALGWSAEGATVEDALSRLREIIDRKIADCTRFTWIEVPMRQPPLLELAGTWKGHPLLEDWRRAVEEYRRSADAHAERDW